MPSQANAHPARGARRRALALLALGLAALALLAAGCGGGGSDTSAAETETEATETTPTETENGGSGKTDGASVFMDADCGSCHTLAAAGTTGVAGPNLDGSTLTQAQIAEQVRFPSGPMPSFADQLSDAEIEAVAQYVFESRTG